MYNIVIINGNLISIYKRILSFTIVQNCLKYRYMLS